MSGNWSQLDMTKGLHASATRSVSSNDSLNVATVDLQLSGQITIRGFFRASGAVTQIIRRQAGALPNAI